MTLDAGAVRDAAAYFERWVGFRRRIDAVPGVQVAIAHGGELVASFAIGEADVAAGTSLTTAHLFRIASHSKTFTATAIMQLAERGALRLDDQLGRWVPELADAPVAGVTIRELLSHAGGLTRDGDAADHWQLDRPFPDTAGLLAIASEVLARNERFKYSNVGYSLLGLIVAAASGQPYETYVTEHIVDRLGLTDTGPELPPEREHEAAVGHSGRALGDRRFAIGHVHAGAMAAATGFYSTAADLARYASAHVLGDGRLLTDDSKRMMQHAAWQVAGFQAGSYGLGLGVSEIGERTVVGHGGGYPGYITRTFVDPRDGRVVCVLTNAIDGPAAGYATAAVRLADDGGYGSPGELIHIERAADGSVTALRGGVTSYPYERVAAAAATAGRIEVNCPLVQPSD